ncbi:MAG TPA: hypothetical protein VLA21_03320 [Candidatus Limnocylindria bacterium]|nr:hypothetical protein [Candidatus Limnocylindria bacterium]
MNGKAPNNDLYATQYTGSPAMMDGIEELLRDIGAPYLRGEDGRDVYTLLRIDMGDAFRARLQDVTRKVPDDVLRFRWNAADSLDDVPGAAYVRDGAFIYADARDVSVAWTGKWMDMEARGEVNALLEDFCVRLGRVRGMESALVILQAGDAQVRAAAAGAPAGFSDPHAGAEDSMDNEYFARLLAAQ